MPNTKIFIFKSNRTKKMSKPVTTFKKTNQNYFLKICLITGLFFSALVSFSAVLPSIRPKNINAEKTIRNYFKFPQILVLHNVPTVIKSKRVEVLFTAGRDGLVNFALAKTDDALLKAEIEKQFYKIRLTKANASVVHSVVLNFKTL